MTARHAAPRRQGGHVKTTVVLVAAAVLLSVATILVFIWLGAEAAAALEWRPPQLTQEQWSIFHKGTRP